MKHLNLLVLSAISAVCLLSLVGAGSAGASVLCTTTDTPECTMSYPQGTAIHISAQAGGTIRFTSAGSTIATCTETTIAGEVGGETSSAVQIRISAMTWSSCSQTTHILNRGALELQRVEGTHNGTVIGRGLEVTFGIFGTSCTYAYNGDQDLGTFTGGAESLLEVNATMAKTSGGFLCPSTTPWEGDLVFTEPHAIFLTDGTAVPGGALCTSAETPDCTDSYSPHTNFAFGLEPKTLVRFTPTGVACEGSHGEGELSGESGTSASIELSELSWKGCNATVHTSVLGSLEIQNVKGTDNGTVFANGMQVTFSSANFDCLYDIAEGSHIGTLTGGAEATLTISATLAKTSGNFLCPVAPVMEAEYTVSEPHSLFVSERSEGLLCKYPTSPCPFAYGKESTVNADLSSELKLESGGSTVATCTGGSFKGKVSNPGSATEEAVVPIEELGWTGCSQTTNVISKGTLEVRPIEGTDNGTVVGRATQVTVVIAGSSCTYGFGEESNLGTLTGSETSPVIEINAAIPKTAGGALCPASVQFVTEYEITEPTPLYVESS